MQLISLHVFIDNYSVHKLSNHLSNSPAYSRIIYTLGNTLDLLSNPMAVASSLHDYYYYNFKLDFDLVFDLDFNKKYYAHFLACSQIKRPSKFIRPQNFSLDYSWLDQGPENVALFLD